MHLPGASAFPAKNRKRSFLADMPGKGNAGNTADDNFQTVKLVWLVYKSSETGKVIHIDDLN